MTHGRVLFGLLVVWLGCLLGGMGCAPDFSIDEDVQIKCQKDSECPEGYTCKSALDLCVLDDASDDKAPQIVSKQVTPEQAGYNAVVLAEFVVNETLFRDPEVVVDGLSDVRFLKAEQQKVENGQRYVYQYTVLGSETPGAYEVKARGLVDRFGNVNSAAVLGDLAFDFTGPDLPQVEISEAVDSDGVFRVPTTDVTLLLRNVDQVHQVLVEGSGLLAPMEWQAASAQLSVSLSGGGDGVRPLRVSYRDSAFNRSEALDLVLELDTAAPQWSGLSVEVAGGFMAARQGSTLNIEGQTEPLATVAMDTVFIVNGAQSPAASGAVVHLEQSGTFRTDITLDVVPDGATDVCFAFVLSDGLNSRDIDGCARPEWLTVVDNVAPTQPLLTIVEGDISNGHDPQRPWVTLQLGLVNSGRESSLQDIEVNISGDGVSDTDGHKDTWVKYPQDHALQVYVADGDGLKTVTAQYRDGAGNEAESTATASFTLDTVAPTDFGITGPDEVSNNSVHLVVLGQGGAQIFIFGDVAAGAQTQQWVDWPSPASLLVTLSGTAERAYTIKAKGRDAAGNETEIKTLTTTLSADAMPYSLPLLEPPAGQLFAKDGDLLLVGGGACSGCTLVQAELIAQDGAGGELQRQTVSSDIQADWGAEVVTLSGTVQMPNVAQDARVFLEVIVNRGGEQSLASQSLSPQLEVDNTAPTAGSVVATPNVTNDRVVTLTFAVTNSNRGQTLDDIELFVDGASISEQSGGAGRPAVELPKATWIPFTERGTVLLTDSETTDTINVIYRDGAHNQLAGASDFVTYDATAPSSPAVVISPAGKTASAQVELTLSASGATHMELTGDLLAQQDGGNWSPGDWIPYTPTSTVQLLPGDGVKAVFVRYRDEALNQSDVVSDQVELDSVAPSGSITLSLAEGRLAIGDNTVATALGAASADATLSSAEIVFLDVEQAVEVERGRSAIGTLVLAEGQFSGSVNSGQIVAATSLMRVEAVLDDGVNQATAVSNTLVVDIEPPAGLTFSFASLSPSPDYTNLPSVAVGVGVINNGQSDNSDLEMLFAGADLDPADPLVGQWVSYSTSANLLLDAAADGLKTATVSVRDGAHNVVGPVVATIILDTDPPVLPSLEIAGPEETASTGIEILLSCAGADQVMVFGDDIVSQTNTHSWIDMPVSGSLQAQIKAVPGSKAVLGKYRDLAGNLSDDVGDGVFFSSDRPVSGPVLSLQGGQTRIKWNDTFSVTGTVSPNSEILTARLLFYDGGGAFVGETDVAGQVFIGGGDVLTGTLTLLEAQTPASAVSMALEVVVRRQGGACPDDCSDANLSLSAPRLTVDKQAPQSPELSVSQGAYVNTPQVTAVFGIDNTGESNWDDIQIYVDGAGIDTGSTPHVAEWIAYQPFMGLVLENSEGAKTINVSYRDGAHHQVGPLEIIVNYDVTRPDLLVLDLEGGADRTESRQVTSSLSARDAYEMHITGEVSGPSETIDQWIPYAVSAALELSDAEGVHGVLATFRDRAGNESRVIADTIELDREPPEIVLTLSPPSGQPAAKGGDVLSVLGQTEPYATVESSRVLDQTLAAISGANASVAIDPVTGLVSGTLTLPGAGSLSGVSSVLLEVVVNEGIHTSAPADSRSNSVVVDVTAPSVTGLTLVAPSGQTAVKDQDTLGVTASSEALATIESATLRGTGASDTDVTDDLTIDSSGTVIGNIVLSGWSGSDVRVEIIVADQVGNQAGLATSNILFVDNTEPSVTASWDAATVVEHSGEDFAWDNNGLVTLNYSVDAATATLALQGSGIDSSWLTLGNCDRVEGATCYLDNLSCQLPTVCSVSLNLAHTAVNSGLDCWDSSYAIGDGAKIIKYWALDEAHNLGETVASVVYLDRSCPSELALADGVDETLPAHREDSGNKYIASSSITLRLATPSVDQDFLAYQSRSRYQSGAWSSWTAAGGADTTEFVFNWVGDGLYDFEVRGADVSGKYSTTASFSVTADTVAPTAPELGPDGVTFNGDGMVVFLTQKSTDPGGDASGADVTYEVIGGPYGSWTQVSLNATALSGASNILYPAFELGGTPALPQQQAVSFFVRGLDRAGNASAPGTLSIFEESTRVVASSSETIRSMTHIYTPAIWGDHLAWSTSNGTSTTVMHTDLGGTTDQIWSNDNLLTEEIQGWQRFVSWREHHVSDGYFLLLYDLGPDEMYNSGDEQMAPNPGRVVTLDGCPNNHKFDWDWQALEVAYVGCDLGVAEVTNIASNPPTTTNYSICSGCVTDVTYAPQVALENGCVVWNNLGGQLEKRCQLAGNWSSTSSEIVTRGSGDCSHPIYTSKARTLDMGELNGERTVVWSEVDDSASPVVRAVCMWTDSQSATRIAEGESTFFLDLIIDDSYIYYSKYVSENNLFIYRYDPVSDTHVQLPITPGAVGRVNGWAGRRVVAAREKLGDADTVLVSEVANEWPLTFGSADHVTPSVDGDTVVWVDYSDHVCGEIVGYSSTLGVVFQITQGSSCVSGNQQWKMCPIISGDRVIWSQQTAAVRPKTCAGEIYGVDISAAPTIGATIHVTSEMTGATLDGFPRLSGDNVVFQARDGFYPYIYHYQWGGTKPTLENHLTPQFGEDPDVDGDRVVYVYKDNDFAGMTNWYQIRTCQIGVDCDAPQVVVGRFNDACVSAGNTYECFKKRHPRLRDSVLVWFDNRHAYDDVDASTLRYHLYYYDFGSPIAGGTQISKTPWIGPTSGPDSIIFQMVELGGTSDLAGILRFWDFARPSIGFDPALGQYFVTLTSARKDMQQGVRTAPEYRSVVRIDLGAAPYEEITISSGNGWQSTPDADGSGNIVWQDRRDGAFFQVQHYQQQ